jgi:hypothetical protein
MKRLLLLTIGILLTVTTLFAQRQVSGNVSDEAGVPLIGAYVTIKGKSLGTVTDYDGYYEVKVPAGTNTLVFSFLGFGTKEVELGTSDQINVVLDEGNDLDEIGVYNEMHRS